MVATTLATDRRRSPDLVAEELVLRVCNSTRAGQNIRLRSAKCTVGSGSRCTLRLRARGVSPLHCLIVRGRAGTIVRRWAPDTRLNQESFTDAMLRPGDRLSIGPIELEVVSVGVEPTIAVEPPSASMPVDAPMESDSRTDDRQPVLEEEGRRLEELAASLQQRETSIAAEIERLDTEHADLDTQRQTLDQQRQQREDEQAEAQARFEEQKEQIAAQLAELEARQNGLAEERGSWESQRDEIALQVAARAEQLDVLQAELDSQRDALAEERRHWESQQDERASELVASSEAIGAERAELDAQHRADQQNREQWEAERHEAQKRLDEQQKQLQVRQTELETQQNALAEERRQWESRQSEAAAQAAAQSEQIAAGLADVEADRQDLEQQRTLWQAEQAEARRQLEEQHADIAAHLAELEARQDAFAEERRQWEAQCDELSSTAQQPSAGSEPVAEAEGPKESPEDEPRFQAPSEGAPVDLADVLRRVGADVEQDEEKPASDEPVVLSEQPSPTAQTQPVAAEAKKEGADEESIDEYMSRLMQRVRTTAGESAPESVPESASSRRSGATQSTHKTTTQQESIALTAPQQRESAELPPRTVTPEKNVNLPAMRELANLSAHSAISRHSHQILLKTMYGKLAVIGVALAAGGGLFWMWKEFGATQMAYYSALVAMVVAIYWGVEYALLTGRLMVSKSGHIDINRRVFPYRKKTAPAAVDDTPENTAAENASTEGDESVSNDT